VCVILFILHFAAANFEYNHVHDEETVKRDNAGMVGGFRPIPNEDLGKYTDLQEGLRQAMELNQNVIFDRNSLVVKSKVVQGVLYDVNVDVRQSCSASSPSEPENCNVKKHCSFQIWSRAWLPEDEKLIVQPLECKS
jgi:hypothetical protein